MRKVTWNSKILKNISKDRHSNFLVIFFLQRKDGPLILATICEDTWNGFNMLHIIPNLKRWDYSAIAGDGHKKIKGPAHMVEGGHHLRKASNPHPHGVSCAMTFDLWPWPISSRSFSHEFATKLLKYDTSCCVCSTAHSSGWILSIFCTNDHYPQIYLAVTPIYIIIFPCDTNITHDGMYHFQFKGHFTRVLRILVVGAGVS